MNAPGMIVEVCVDRAEFALAAQECGASRIELCGDLGSGGTTPSLGEVELAAGKCSIPIHVMIRPRGGSFVHGAMELEVMSRDIVHAARAGARGAVFGVLDSQGRVDRVENARLITIAKTHGLQVTFHRAFDVCQDPEASLEELVKLGVDHILTSGQCDSAMSGLHRLGSIVKAARGRVNIIAAAGIVPENAMAIAGSGVQAIHFTARRKADGSNDPRFGETWHFDTDKVLKIVRLVR